MFALVGFSAIVWVVPWLLAAPKNLRGVRTSLAVDRSAPERRIHFNRNLVGLCLGFFCFDYYWYLLVTWLPDYLVTVRHLTLLRAGMYASLPFFVFGICQPLGGSIGDALVRRGFGETRTRKSMLVVAFLSGLFLIPAARAHDPHMALAFFMGGGLVGLASGNMFAIIQCCAPPDELGIWTGFENTAGNIAGVLAPIVTGFLIARTGSYFPGFALAAGVLAAGILAYELIVGELNPAAPQFSSETNGKVQTTGA
jgi:nitrate/nitrite transporter NarK